MIDALLLNNRNITYSDIKDGNIIGKTEFEEATLSFCREWLNGTQEFDQETSGSTGPPKIINLTREKMRASAMGTIAFFNLKPNDTALVCLNPAYIAGKMMLVRSFESNMKIVAVEPSGNPLIDIEHHIDFMAVVPLQLQNILTDESTNAKLSDVRQTIVGGSSINIALQQLIDKSEANIYATFGMTETITHIALRQLSPELEADFTVINNISFGQDSRGCLTVSGPVTGNQLLVTNDLINITATNKFRWIGRIDNIINSGSVKIPVEALEEKIGKVMTENGLDHRFFIYSQPDEVLGEKVMLLVESEYSVSPALQPLLMAALKKYELPKSIDFYSQFLETATGKIDRNNTLSVMNMS